MKQTPDLDRVQQRMGAGELSLKGFLGDDDRKLADILAEDHETVRRRGLAHEQIANRLGEIGEAGTDLMEREVLVENRYKVRVRDDRGRMPSPWGDGLFAKGDVSMQDTVTGHHFHWNGLTLHMIREHGFYGGRGSTYRIDPDAVIDAIDTGWEKVEDAAD